MSVLGRLDQPCPVCARVSGDHTLREWSLCMGAPTTDLPYEPVPESTSATAALAGSGIRTAFGVDSDVIVADNVVVRALTLSGRNGPVALKLPGLMHDFSIGIAGHPPETVARVLFLGDDGVMRRYGELARDSANGAANAAHQSSGGGA